MHSTEAKAKIQSAVDELLRQLQAGKSEALTAYLAAMGRFHNYSFGNVMLIARQRPDATHVAGYRAWQQFGRYVRKGEHGILILAPLVGKKKIETEDGEEREEPTLYGFRGVYVFDVSQTDGAPLPELDTAAKGEVGEYRARLNTFLAERGIAIEFCDAIAPASGVSFGGKIQLLPGQSSAEEFATLVHETAHELLHKKTERAELSKTVRELEAESVAFVVGSAIGLQMDNTSADYIALYGGDATKLRESLERIQSTAQEILASIEPAKLDLAA